MKFPRVERTAVVSTSNITVADARLLNANYINPFLVVFPIKNGWLVAVPSDKKDFKDHMASCNRFSKQFRQLFRECHMRKIDFLKIDNDGPLVAGLKTFI